MSTAAPVFNRSTAAPHNRSTFVYRSPAIPHNRNIGTWARRMISGCLLDTNPSTCYEIYDFPISEPA